MKFIKMQSLGNDFIIIENTKEIIDVVGISDRHFGIGCDQLMIVNDNNVGLDLQIFNQDGTIANMCGNGLRCIAGRYFDKNIDKDVVEITILPKAQKFFVTKQDNNLVKVNMGRPYFAENDFVEIGNLHKIIQIQCDNNKLTDIEILDFILNKADKKPHDEYNVNYFSINNNKLYLVTIERGVGETLACGSGSTASVCFVIKNILKKNSKMQIINKGVLRNNEQLWVEYTNNSDAYLIGGYNYVFKGNML